MEKNAMKESYMRGKKASMKNGEKHEGEKELERISIREADNGGFILSCSYRIKHDGKGPMSMSNYDDSEKVFKSWDDAAAFLDDMYGED